MKIATLIMVKNEEDVICNSLNSIKNYSDLVILLDTGSTDDTIQVIKNYCTENRIKYYIKSGEFIDFSTSRNELIQFAEKETESDIDFFLLLDSNDELKNGSELINLCKKELEDESSINSGYILCQEWYNGIKATNYFNIRLIRPNRGWKYIGVVHEYIANMDRKSNSVSRLSEIIVIFQDRTTEKYKSRNRFKRDKDLLLNEYNLNSGNTRNVFYLAQTFECLKDYENAIKFYKLRTTMGGFNEEIFHSYLRIGNLYRILDSNSYESIVNYMKSYECNKRVEPLLELSKFYINKNEWSLAFMFCNLACECKYPVKDLLFIDKLAYNYTRWHYMGIIGYNCGKMKEGESACLKAIEYKPESFIDENILQQYRV